MYGDSPAANIFIGFKKKIIGTGIGAPATPGERTPPGGQVRTVQQSPEDYDVRPDLMNM